MHPSIADQLEGVLTLVSPCYRAPFTQAIQDLTRKGLIGPDKARATRIFFNLLVEVHNDGQLEHMLNRMLQSLRTENLWLLRHPILFQAWSDLAVSLSREKTYMGVRYVDIWAAGGLGETPVQMGPALDKARRLIKTDVRLALNFLIGYAKLSKHLETEAMDRFIGKALLRYARSPEQSFAFLQVGTKAAEAYMCHLSLKGSMGLHKQRLEHILRAISGAPLGIDALPEGSVGLGSHAPAAPLVHDNMVYLPAQISEFGNRGDNFDHLRLMTVVCASAYAQQSFCRSHGRKGKSTSLALFRDMDEANAMALNNCFICTEVYRVLSRVEASFEGLRPALTRALKHERKHRQVLGDDLLSEVMEHLLSNGGTSEAIGDSRGKIPRTHQDLVTLFKETALTSSSYIETALALVTATRHNPARFHVAGILDATLRPLSFFPDYTYPLTTDVGSPGLPVRKSVDHPQQSSMQHSGHDIGEATDPVVQMAEDGGGSETVQTGDRKTGRMPKPRQVGQRFFYYDEWNRTNDDYHPRWVRLKEIRVMPAKETEPLSDEQQVHVRQVKRAFEMLKPDLMRKQKFLLQGDEIDDELLIEHLCNLKAGLCPEPNFYQKPYINRRDLAVALLLDLSGSTSNPLDNGKQVIDMEKEAAFVLGEGLADLGDRFGIFGFTGQGRLQAEYFCFKGFEDPWDDTTKRALLEAEAGSATRMGAAIRHTGQRLANVGARKKLVLVITDGKPMDSDYSPHDGYAQFDVAKAVGELKQQATEVFCISTEENKIDDLEIMFPNQRFAIIKSMTDLPKLLTRFYLKLTV